MVNKKKYLNIFYMFSLVALFVIYLGLYSSSYAMTDDEFIGYCNVVKTNYIDKNIITNDIDFYINNVSTLSSTLENYDSIFFFIVSVNYLNGGTQLVLYNSNNSYLYFSSDNTYINIKKSASTGEYNLVGIVGSPSRLSNLHYNIGNYGAGITSFSSDNRPYYSNTSIYNYNSEVVSNLVDYISLVPANSIILNSSSNHKFGFDDKNQCQAYLTGYNIEDIQFYVDRYVNEEWQQFTDVNDYYLLSNETNPYYVFWSNMNYFPVGTYRYRAVYDYDNQYTSDSFSITNMIIDNEGTYNNGSININSGNTLDNIKDYFGGKVDTSIGNISEDDLKNSLNMKTTENPYENFVFTIVDGLLDSLVGTSPEYITFKVHSWGQTFKIYVEDIVPNYGTDLRNFLTLISTVVVMIYIIRWITKVVESVNVADIDTTLDLIEEKYSDLL